MTAFAELTPGIWNIDSAHTTVGFTARHLMITKVRGRPAHVFVFRPPAAFAAQYPELGAVRVFLDTQYNAPTQIESLNRDARVVKTLSLLDLKKVGEQWIPKSFEVRDEMTRDKTRLSVNAAALGLALPSAGPGTE